MCGCAEQIEWGCEPGNRFSCTDCEFRLNLRVRHSYCWKSHLLRGTHVEIVCSGHRERLLEYTVFDLKLLKRCFQKYASACGSTNQFPMMGFINVRLRGAEQKKCISSRYSLRCAVGIAELSMPFLVEVVANILVCGP